MQVLAIPRSTIGRKALMAITGLVWIGFVAMHMWGNLHIFQGAESFNHYAEFLREVGDPLFSYGQGRMLRRGERESAIRFESSLMHPPDPALWG